ncbi:hypothetical protein K443DRAFT_674520 [Laccaria amethystina LaAM-08-1]|uniref:Uncharacterized protein n=1 Tax=Laccaria amethystina LaAM-08-1 TaxID=1095629 RepID=A0A0C9XMB3_9AGAR|nr:hypothetical protein K443DRAFT_674520 [Laccaria amethystina LaAM-08-1]
MGAVKSMKRKRNEANSELVRFRGHMTVKPDAGMHLLLLVMSYFRYTRPTQTRSCAGIYDQYLREALICGSQAASLHVSDKFWG